MFVVLLILISILDVRAEPSISPSLDSTLIRYGGFVQSVYNQLGTGSTASSSENTSLYKSKKSSISNFTALGLKQENSYIITRYLYCTENTGILQKLMGTTNETVLIGYTAVSSDQLTQQLGRRDFAVVLRGTMTGPEWIQNIAMDQVPFSYINGSSSIVKVHQGFLRLYNTSDANQVNGTKSLRQQILEELASLAETYKNENMSITLTGHSLGGALGILSAFDIANSNLILSSRLPMFVYTFASPMVGDSIFKGMIEQIPFVNILRVADARDLVPYLPSDAFSYTHVGIAMAVDGCKFDTNNTANENFISKIVTYHSLDRYLRTVAGLNNTGSGVGNNPQNRANLSAILNDIMNFLKELIDIVKKPLEFAKMLVSYALAFSSACNN